MCHVHVSKIKVSSGVYVIYLIVNFFSLLAGNLFVSRNWPLCVVSLAGNFFTSLHRIKKEEKWIWLDKITFLYISVYYWTAENINISFLFLQNYCFLFYMHNFGMQIFKSYDITKKIQKLQKMSSYF